MRPAEMTSRGDVVRIRAARNDEASVVAEVHVASWRWAYEGLLPEETLAGLSVEERATTWTAAIADPDPSTAVLVAVDPDDRVIGFASTGPTDEDGAESGTGELYAIYLLFEAAGRGIGSGLLAAASTTLREAGFGRATLWVLESNDRARGFYERHGWRWDGARSAHRFDCANLPIVRYAAEL